MAGYIHWENVSPIVIPDGYLSIEMFNMDLDKDKPRIVYIFPEYLNGNKILKESIENIPNHIVEIIKNRDFIDWYKTQLKGLFFYKERKEYLDAIEFCENEIERHVKEIQKDISPYRWKIELISNREVLCELKRIE